MSQKVIELATYEEVRKNVPLKFKVKTVPPELTEGVVELMASYFISYEPLCSHFKFKEDTDSVEAFKNFWRELIHAGATMVAIREGPEAEKERIIGANMTAVCNIDEKVELKGDNLFSRLTTYVLDMASKVNIFEKYSVDKYITAVGLTVHKDYHGYKVGERLLESRRFLAQALGIKVSSTMFTNPISQHIAEKVGFIHLITDDYKNYRYNGENVLKYMEGGYTYSAIVYS